MADTEAQQLETWAAEILAGQPGQWVVPDTYSMRAALDRLWLKVDGIEKGWQDGRNAYRLAPRSVPGTSEEPR